MPARSRLVNRCNAPLGSPRYNLSTSRTTAIAKDAQFEAQDEARHAASVKGHHPPEVPGQADSLVELHCRHRRAGDFVSANQAMARLQNLVQRRPAKKREGSVEADRTSQADRNAGRAD